MPSTKNLWEDIHAVRTELTALSSSVQANIAEVKEREQQVASLYNQLLSQTGDDSILAAVPLTLCFEKGVPSATNNDPTQYLPCVTVPVSTQIAGLGETLDDLFKKCRIQKHEFAWTSVGVSGTPDRNGLNCKFTMAKVGAVFKITLSNAANILPVTDETIKTNDEVKLQSARLLVQWLTGAMGVKTIDTNTNSEQLLKALTGQKTGIENNIELITEIMLAFTESD